MSESTNPVARERLEALIGEWTMEAAPPDEPPWPGGGRVTFEWLEGGPLLIERWHVDLPEAPDGVAVIGCDGTNDTYYQLYTDERDVQRIYEMSLTTASGSCGETASPSPNGSRGGSRRT